MKDLSSLMVNNVSVDEFFKYYRQDPNAVTLYEDNIKPKLLELDSKGYVTQKDYDFF